MLSDRSERNSILKTIQLVLTFKDHFKNGKKCMENYYIHLYLMVRAY